MTAVLTHAPGTVCWTELGTTDPAAARPFYRALFGWDATEVPMPEDMGTYTLLQQDDRDMAGIYELTADQKTQNVPPHWLLYTAVEDVDAVADTAQANGGAVLAPPTDVPEVGRMAVLADPEGATFAVMHLAGHPGLGAKETPGALCWTELSSRDRKKAAAFYGALFGWEANEAETPGGLYTMFSLDGTDVGGIVHMNEEWGDMPAAWMPYFGVADIDAALDTVAEHGGTAASEVIEAKGVGRFAVVQDPQGAYCSIIQLDAFQ